MSAAAAAPKAAAGGAAKPAAAAKVEEPEEEEDVDMGGLFGDDYWVIVPMPYPRLTGHVIRG